MLSLLTASLVDFCSTMVGLGHLLTLNSWPLPPCSSWNLKWCQICKESTTRMCSFLPVNISSWQSSTRSLQNKRCMFQHFAVFYEANATMSEFILASAKQGHIAVRLRWSPHVSGFKRPWKRVGPWLCHRGHFQVPTKALSKSTAAILTHWCGVCSNCCARCHPFMSVSESNLRCAAKCDWLFTAHNTLPPFGREGGIPPSSQAIDPLKATKITIWLNDKAFCKRWCRAETVLKPECWWRKGPQPSRLRKYVMQDLARGSTKKVEMYLWQDLECKECGRLRGNPNLRRQ